ncbi:hypothetical protein FALBO_1018 [Fusarium albosuccineum]|uniref:Transcriptional regulatory protein RXT2 N-terminal domain-containing protein n=1 Tax=Fusarium albosuccineum TaxID=1237068 RepID=A0A8H4LPR4_9HYPO|nr:hypothetical protein FALBO_1018 [Fusarium albosuccineum]
MASQQILFAETIAGMKKAFKRKAYESDSDSEIESYSNRGHKLKKRARFAHQGQLVPTNGPSSYREYVEYGGVRRPILHRNPPLVDEEGYEIESDDEDDDRFQEAEAAAAALNPYANIQIERADILAPLTASTALPTHPTLSKPFTSKTLTKLVDQSCDIMRKENRSLWQVRHLLTALCGDYTWVPCEMMVRPSDIDLYTDDHVARHLLSLSKAHPPLLAIMNGDAQQENGIHTGDTILGASGDGLPLDKDAAEDADITMTDASTVVPEDTHQDAKDGTKNNTEKDGLVQSPNAQDGEREPVDETNPPGQSSDETQNGTDMGTNQDASKGKDDAGAGAAQTSGGATVGDTHHQDEMAEVTAQDISVISEGHEPTFVHPMFIAPSGAKPDKDVGLPDQEAEDIRRLLALYVQKQEEVCRGAKRLFLGLLKAEQLRKNVLHWSKAEAHSGPNRDMSDGEDWYDKEEWGLTEDLKKGQDEEEEDTQTTGKKTRNRR